MDYQVDIEDRGTYLHARVRGPNTPQVTRKYLDELDERCAALGRRGLLIEEHLVGPSLSTMDIFRIASDVQGDRRPYPWAVAFVDVSEHRSPTKLRFAEDVAVNRGVNLRVFERVEDAEKWIVTQV